MKYFFAISNFLEKIFSLSCFIVFLYFFALITEKALFNEQCKIIIIIEENNRRGKSKNLFKKIGAIKEIFHAKMGTITDINHKDLIEAEEIKK